MAIKELLIYDGDCQFCRLSLDFAIRKLKNMPEYVAFQRIDPKDYGLTTEQVSKAVWLVSAEHPPLAGHLAVAAMFLDQSNFGYKFLGLLMKYPPTSWVAGWVYGFVAANRHRMPGGTRECDIRDSYSA
ncbi:MAG: thiol-disulfide oxidoreductase DCC family protein [Actinomycetota bacterium]